MHGSRLSAVVSLSGAILVIIFLVLAPVGVARVIPEGFQIPARMTTLGRTVTPGEYALLRQAIKANWNREKAGVLRSGPPLGSNFTHISATRIRLGSLGQALVVYFGNSPECGATGNCPMAVYVREPKGYRRVIKAGGWGDALLPSGGTVPDVAFYWNTSAAESDAQLFHYAQGKFVQGSTAVCNGKNSSALCAAMNNGSQSPSGGISSSDYDGLRPAVEAGLNEQSPSLARNYSFLHSHAVGILSMQRISATAVGLGPCGYNHNCRISIYAHHNRGSDYWPLLSTVAGWGVSQVSLESSGGRQITFVIARRLSSKADELTRYSVPLTVTAHTADLTHNSRLLPDACEIVAPKTNHWPAQWDAAALVARPVSCFSGNPPGKSEIAATDTTNISRAVQDGSGTVWAMGSERLEGLFRWRNGGWNKVSNPIPGAISKPGTDQLLEENGETPQPIGLWPGPDGGVLALWLKSASTQQSELIWLRGDEKKILSTLPAVHQTGAFGHINVRAAAPAASGVVLISGDGPHLFEGGIRSPGQAAGLFRLAPNGQIQRIDTFTPSMYMRRRGPGGRAAYYLPLRTTRDLQGKVWIWARWPWIGAAGGEVLTGFLVTNGETAEYHRRIPGMIDYHLSSLNVWDDHHLAAATFGDGLYTIDTTTFEAQHIPEPRPGAFFYVIKVFRAGNDRYVLTLGPGFRKSVRPEFRPFLTGSLWRLHNGQWTEVVSGIRDASGATLATARGIWLGARLFRSLWFVPRQGPARRVDWREGLPLTNANQLFRLPGGNILATMAGPSATTRSVEFNPATVLARRPERTRYSVIHPVVGMQPDRHQHIWGLLPNRILGEWNGSRWIRHPLPAVIQPDRLTRLDVDTRGRVWLFPDCRMGPTGFFNPVERRWTTFRDYRKGLSERAHPVEFLHPADDQARPIYGPRSQIVFEGPCSGINYFDGAAWHLIQGRLLPPDRNIAIPPFFTADGHLALNIRNSTWQWIAGTGWQQTDEAPPENYVRLLPNPFATQPSPPAGCSTLLASSLVKDPLGRSWWVAGDALYEGVPGQCRVVIPGSARQPFIDGRRLVAAQLDGHGNAFLKTDAPFSYIMLPQSMYAGRPVHRPVHRAAAH